MSDQRLFGMADRPIWVQMIDTLGLLASQDATVPEEFPTCGDDVPCIITTGRKIEMMAERLTRKVFSFCNKNCTRIECKVHKKMERPRIHIICWVD